jgi:pyruvate dehydrogenase E2 component (dihydrolipoamide acetyltransferase)
MPTEFKIPELGENITAGDVVRVLVKPGDTLAQDQPVLELETDKATIEVPSTVSGKVVDIAVKQGDKVKVGQLVLTVDADGDGGGKAASAPAEPAAREETATKPKPQPAGAAEEGGISQQAPEAKAEPEKVADPAPKETKDAKPKPRGEVVDISRGARSAPPPQQPEPQPGAPAAPAAPSVRRLARELGVEIGRVAGSGPGGRISVEDVQEFVKGVMSGSGAVAPAGVAAPPRLPDFGKWGDVERKPMSNIRRKTAEHLSQAWNAIPHVTQHDKADISELEELRKQYAPEAEKAGGKLTMTAMALKIAAGALRKFPQFNSSLDVARSEIIFKNAVHVGVAVDTPRGLLVPVIRNVDQKGIFELSAELAQASEKARAGKLSLDEMQGAGFTITNLGGIGGTSFTPIVNWPEVAILGISRAAFEPVHVNGEFRPRLLLPLSLSYDHRVIDGADAARFLRWVASAFEQPLVLAL